MKFSQVNHTFLHSVNSGPRRGSRIVSENYLAKHVNIQEQGGQQVVPQDLMWLDLGKMGM